MFNPYLMHLDHVIYYEGSKVQGGQSQMLGLVAAHIIINLHILTNRSTKSCNNIKGTAFTPGNSLILYIQHSAMTEISMRRGQ